MKIVFKAVGPVGLAALPLHVVLGPKVQLRLGRRDGVIGASPKYAKVEKRLHRRQCLLPKK